MTGVVLQAAPNLRALCFFGTGYESYIDVATGRDLGLAMSYTPHANVDAVAEMTLGLMLAPRRGILHLNRATKAGLWSEEVRPGLICRTLGIVGMGRIGRAVARAYRSAFGMKIVLFNRTDNPAAAAELGAEQRPLPEVLEVADVVSIHCAFDPTTTRHLIGAGELALMKPGALLVNTARAEIVEPAALRDALMSGRIAGAAFDVYYVEPVPPPEQDPVGLLALPDSVFLLTPHAGTLSTDAILRMSMMAADNLLALARGDRPPYPIPAPGEYHRRTA